MVVLFAALAWAVSAQLPATPIVELTSAERAALESGKQIVREDPSPGAPWPRVTVLQLVEASPREAAAVFADYDLHSTYLPGVKKSAVSRQLSPRVAEVDYLLYVPVFADEHYTVRDSLTRSADGASYRIDWSMVRARSTKSILGHVRFEPYRNPRPGTQVTLVTYVNLVVPGQRLAGPLKGRALKQVRETVIALGKQIELVRAKHPDRVASLAAALDAALAADTMPPP